MMRGSAEERNATGSEIYVQAVVVKKEKNGLAKLPHMHDAVQGCNHMLWNDDIVVGISLYWCCHCCGSCSPCERSAS